MEGRVDAEMDETRAATEKAAVAEVVTVDARHERARAEAHAHEARACAEEVESRAWKDEVRAREVEAEAEARVQEAETRAEMQIREAEARAKAQIHEAEARVANTIANYKASPEFERKFIEASFDAYVKGFDLCKARVSTALNINSSKLEEIQSGDLGGEEPAEEEEAGEEPGPSEP